MASAPDHEERGMLAKLARMPTWPARMTADVAALYMGMSKGSFLTRYRKHGREEGANVYWSRRQLDGLVDAQFGLAPPSRAGAVPGGGEIDTWADL